MNIERMSDCGSCEKEKRQKVNKTEDIVVPNAVTRDQSNAVSRGRCDLGILYFLYFM